MSEEKRKHYDFCLPVFKQGDDLAHHIETGASFADAFIGCAEQYEAAARLCRRMASVAVETPDLDVVAGAHFISCSTEKAVDRFDALVQEEFIYNSEWSFEEEDDVDSTLEE